MEAPVVRVTSLVRNAEYLILCYYVLRKFGGRSDAFVS